MAWEHDLLLSLQSIRSPFMDGAMAFFSYINDHFIICLVLTVALLIFRRTRRVGVQMLIAIALVYLVSNLVIKNIVARPRPYEVYTDIVPLLPKPHDASFPSGHTVSAFAAATIIFLNNKKFGILAFVIAALIGFSRLYNAVHFPTDVFAGAAIGIVGACLVYYLLFPAAEKCVRKLRHKN